MDDSYCSCRYSTAIALSEKFLWEVFLTDKWDHIFEGYIPHLPDLLPRNLSFCPTKRSWRNISSKDGVDYKEITYIEPIINTQIIIIRMRRETSEEDRPFTTWYPDSIHIEISVLEKEMARKYGIERIAISDFIKAEHKK